MKNYTVRLRKPFWIGYLLSVFVLTACINKPVSEETETPKEIRESVEADEVKVEKSTSVVTPEFWENFDTDIEMVIFFHNIDSLTTPEKHKLQSLKEEFPLLEFNEFYSDDKLAQVFLNDTLAFDISYYLQDKEKGFVLLKPGFPPKYEFLSDSLSKLKINFYKFYRNK